MNPTPPNPKNRNQTDALNSVFYLIEGGEDTTRRPHRKHIPLPPPEDQPPPEPKDKPPEEKK